MYFPSGGKNPILYSKGGEKERTHLGEVFLKEEAEGREGGDQKRPRVGVAVESKKPLIQLGKAGGEGRAA